MAPHSCSLIGRAAVLNGGSDSLLLSSEEPPRVKTRQRGPTNYQPTPCFQPPFPLSEYPTFLPLPHPYCSAAGWVLPTYQNSHWPNKSTPTNNHIQKQSCILITFRFFSLTMSVSVQVMKQPANILGNEPQSQVQRKSVTEAQTQWRRLLHTHPGIITEK